jgi:hypothetical protein
MYRNYFEENPNIYISINNNNNVFSLCVSSSETINNIINGNFIFYKPHSLFKIGGSTINFELVPLLLNPPIK